MAGICPVVFYYYLPYHMFALCFTVRKQSLGQSLAEDLVVGRPDGTNKKKKCM